MRATAIPPARAPRAAAANGGNLARARLVRAGGGCGDAGQACAIRQGRGTDDGADLARRRSERGIRARVVCGSQRKERKEPTRAACVPLSLSRFASLCGRVGDERVVGVCHRGLDVRRLRRTTIASCVSPGAARSGQESPAPRRPSARIRSFGGALALGPRHYPHRDHRIRRLPGQGADDGGSGHENCMGHGQVQWITLRWATSQDQHGGSSRDDRPICCLFDGNSFWG